ncbi:hypothetical protein [Stenotrophomonas maltophilia]|uniref:hypothetical protein n=1 Tax=Stenotrophomonas maltophilia TaxID=40324 RepID=UPI001FA6D921|nr:hypothetical protein [Stenotrophomonas maltophilia]
MTAAMAVSRHDNPVTPFSLKARAGVIVVLGFALIHAVVVMWRAQSFFFYGDDFLNFAVYVETGFNWAYLMRDVFGQMAPGYRLMQAMAFELFGMDYTRIQMLLAVVTAGTTALLGMAALRLGSRPWVLAVALPLLVLLPQSGQATMWWSAAVHTTFSFAAISAALFCASGNSPARAVLISMWLALSLLFTAKALFSLALLWGFLALRESQQGRHWFRASLSALWTLIPSIFVALAYLALLKAFHEPSIQPHPSPLVLAAYIWELTADYTIGSSIGLGSYGLGWPRSVSVALVLPLAVASVRKRPALLFPWVALFIYLAASAGAIGWERAVRFPGGTLRYCVEGSTLLLIVSALSVSAIRQTALQRLIVIAVATLIAINLGWHRSDIPLDADRDSARSFIANYQHDVALLPAGATIADTQLPEKIVPGWMVGYSRAGWLTRLYAPTVSWGSIETATHIVEEDGSITPILPATNSE